MLGFLGDLVWGACALVGAVSLALYLVPLVIYSFWLPEQNLKRKYNADWGMPGARSPTTSRASG